MIVYLNFILCIFAIIMPFNTLKSELHLLFDLFSILNEKQLQQYRSDISVIKTGNICESNRKIG